MAGFPIPSWLSGYRRAWIRADVAAGLTSAAVVIPKAMASAAIAGLSVGAGLHTALATLLVYPLLGSSRALSVTTTSAIAMLTAAAVAETNVAIPGADAAEVAALLALLVGGTLLLAPLFRLGVLANFISKPVLVGFEAGVGTVICIVQLPVVLGVHGASRTTIGTLLELPSLLPHAHMATALTALAGLTVLIAVPRLFPKLSAPMLWVALSIGASAALGLEAMGVRLVGAVPPGLPPLALPRLSLAEQLWPAALGIALMSFAESVASARTAQKQDDAPVNANRELLALGAANVAASLAGGMPSGGGASQTAIANAAGARSQMAQWVNAGAVLATLLFLSQVIGLMPKPALGALVLVAAASMIKPGTFGAIARIHKAELMWAFVTLAGVILVGTLEGILIAVAVSVLTLIYQANHPPVYAMAYSPSKDVFLPAGEDEGEETFPGLLMLRTEGRLTFANADLAREKMRALLAEANPRTLVLECSAIPDIEYTALTTLVEVEASLRAGGITLWLAAVNPDMLTTIRRSTLGTTLGPDRIFPNLRQAVAAHRLAGDRPSPAEESSAHR